MKKAIWAFAVAFVLVLILAQTVNASTTVEVTIANPQINPGGFQQITATTNHKGTGVIFVVEPTTAGETLTTSLRHHWDLWWFWIGLSSSERAEIASETGNSIVSYVIVSMPSGGGSKTYSFPTDFKAINGQQPSTAMAGTYRVIFAFISSDHEYCHFRVDFDCGRWFVVPESQLGTVMALAVPIVALATVVTYKKRKTNP